MDLAGDPQLRAIVQAARAWGISPKRLLGWEPRQVTVHEYDSSGRLARSTTTVEAEWDDEQRQLVFALQSYEADLCPGCGQPMAETTQAENEGRYVPGPAVRCHRCTAADQAFKKYENSPAAQALFIPVRLEDGPGRVDEDKEPVDHHGDDHRALEEQAQEPHVVSVSQVQP